MDSKDIVSIAVKALEDKKCENIKIIDISTVSILGDYFIIGEGNNPNQIQAICNNADDMLGREGINPRQIEGYNNANWILMDYGDVIIHIFDKENRSFYNLERIWKDGTELDISQFR